MRSEAVEISLDVGEGSRLSLDAGEGLGDRQRRYKGAVEGLEVS
jgi:hypothetical protein